MIVSSRLERLVESFSKTVASTVKSITLASSIGLAALVSACENGPFCHAFSNCTDQDSSSVGYTAPSYPPECRSTSDCKDDSVCEDTACVSIGYPDTVEQKTDAHGKAHFTDQYNDEPVTIIVTDTAGNTLKGISVSFFDRRDYEAFVAHDPSERYLPALNLYDHNSTHTIKMCRRDAGLCVSQVLDTDVTGAYSLWSSEIFGDQERYLKTVDLTEKIAREQSRRENRDELFFYGTEKFIIILSGRYDRLAGAVLDTFSVKEMWEVLKRTSGFVEPSDSSTHPRWDVYEYEKWERFGRLFQVPVSAGTAIVPSNIPAIGRKWVDEGVAGFVRVSWEASDQEWYNTSLIVTDKTAELPPTPSPDLTFTYTLHNAATGERTSGDPVYGTPYNPSHSVSFQLSHERRHYTLDLRVRDEVNNTTSVTIPLGCSDIAFGSCAQPEEHPPPPPPPPPPPVCRDNDGDGFTDRACGGTDCDDTRRDVNPRAPEVTDGRDNNCDGGIDEHLVGAGDPQVTLFWNGSSDLDLHVYTPDGACHLSYQNRDCGAGHLDRDARAACVQRDEPPENIFFDRGAAPNGQYTVAVRYYQDCGDGPARFRLAMSVNGRVVRSVEDTLQRACQGDADRAPDCEKEYTFQK